MSSPPDPDSNQPVSGNAPESLSADDALPPVETPSAGFIFQLFLIPLFIVSVIVMVWLLFGWLAHMDSNPHQYVQNLKNAGQSSWQSAASLADVLRNPRHKEYKSDVSLAQDLSEVLKLQLEASHLEESALRMRIFICRALGEFYVPDVLPVLIEAATTERDPREIDVRRAAMEAIAVLADNIETKLLVDNADLLPALRATAKERSSQPGEEEKRGQLRATSAFTLGVIGTEEAIEILATMQNDAYADARYNAATGLARHGDARAEKVLLQMINPETKITAGSKLSFEDLWKYALVVTNGLRATEQLIEKNSEDDFSKLEESVRRLLNSNIDPQIKKNVQLKAQELLLRFEQKKTIAS